MITSIKINIDKRTRSMSIEIREKLDLSRAKSEIIPMDKAKKKRINAK